MPSSSPRSRTLARGGLAALGVLAATASVAVGAAGRADSGTAWVSANHQEGSTLWVGGDIKDKLLGRGAIVYQTTVRAGDAGAIKVTAKTVTLYAKGGSITGSGSAVQKASADGKDVTVSDGQVKLTKGSGALKGHTFVATFGGTFKDGTYTFKYKGTYK